MKKINVWVSMLMGCLVTAAVAGCGASKTASPLGLVAGKTFDVESIQGIPLSQADFPSKKPFISFGSDGKATGNTGCNNFNGSFTATSDKLTIAPGAMTRMACSGTGEQQFLRALEAVDAVQVVKNKILLLQGSNEMMRLIPKP